VSASITAEADGAESSADAEDLARIYEVVGGYFEGYVGSFTNSGIISASADIGQSISGDITALAANGGVADAWLYAEVNDILGAYFGNEVGAFTNTGTISASALLGNVSGSSITAEADGAGSNAYAGLDAGIEYIYGTYFYEVGAFDNSGTISASALLGDVSASITAEADGGAGSGAYAWLDADIEYIYGTYFGNEVSAFTNTGTISASALLGDVSASITAKADGAESYAEARLDARIDEVYGAYFYYEVGSFTNSGTISASARMGNVDFSVSISETNGGSAEAELDVGIENVAGVSFDGDVSAFENSGSISALAQIGDINVSGEGADIEAGIYEVAGAVFEEYVGSFANSGAIYASATTGDATGAQVGVKDVVGALFDGGAGTIDNSGTIAVAVKSGQNSEVMNVAGLVLENASGTFLDNTGNILVSVDGAGSTVDQVAGIYINNSSDVTLSNPGTVWLSVPDGAANVRTLWVENSTATLDESFSLVFGAPGIDPSHDDTANLDKRPIYVGDGSTLDLNDADLITRVDSRNLRFNTPYYLIQNEGTVENEFGGLVKGWTNPELTANWVGENNGENAAVKFNYVPGTRSRAVAMGYPAASIVSSTFAQTVTGFSPGGGSPLYFLTEKKDERILLASAAATPATLISPAYDKGIFLMPVYTRVEADDLGFDADAYGFALGVGGELRKDLAATLYGGYSRVDLDFDVTGPREEEQDIFVGGLSLTYAPKPVFAKFLANFHRADHDYEGRTGDSYELYEKADYDSWGLDLELTGGYLFGNKKFSVVPEIGLGYTYYEADDFHTEVAANPGWNRRYDTDSVDFAKGILGLHGVARFNGGQSKSMLYGSVRLEQAFGDNDVSVISCLQGLPRYRLEQDISNTTVVCQLGLGFRIADRWMLDINGRGDFNGDYNAYTGRAMLKYTF